MKSNSGRYDYTNMIIYLYSRGFEYVVNKKIDYQQEIYYFNNDSPAYINIKYDK